MASDSAKWLAKAKQELRAAKYNFEGGEFEVAAFLCQQAAEKALKAIYIKKFSDLTKTHDLVFLAREAGAPEKLVEFCRELAPAFVYTRYPDVIEVGDMKQVAEEFISYAEEVVKWVEGRL